MSVSGFKSFDFLIVFIIISMQEEQIEMFEQLVSPSSMSLIEDILNLEERKIESQVAEPAPQRNAQGGKNVLRGKGRPKGEKNSKEGSKRNKNSVPSENQRRGHWVLEENKRYHWFLQIYHNHFICKEMRRLDKIFKTMATFIGTREAQQCRSHHQKMEKKYHNFCNILLFLRQSHYSSDETAPILEDMDRADIKQKTVLLDPQSLHTIETPKTSIATLPFPEQEKEDEIFQISKFVDFGEEPNFNTFSDMFGDNYQLQLQLDNQLLI